jgi:cytochrome c oxidase subunit 2
MNETWFKAEVAGVYRGQCAELCGMDHGYMPIVVEVVEPEAYQAWLANEKDRVAQVAAADGEIR